MSLETSLKTKKRSKQKVRIKNPNAKTSERFLMRLKGAVRFSKNLENGMIFPLLNFILFDF